MGSAKAKGVGGILVGGQKLKRERMLLFWVMSSLLLTCFVLLRSSCARALLKLEPRLPPGSMGWPVIGETMEFLQPHSATSRGRFMENHSLRYGTVFKSSLFGQPTIVSADPDLNRFILQNEDTLFQCSYPSTISGILGKWSMLVLVGDAHKQMRSIALSFMKSSRLKDFFLDDIQQHVLLVLDSWKDGDVVSAQEEAKKFTFNLMAKQILSFNPGEPRTLELMRDYYTFMKGVIAPPINLPGTAYYRAIRSRTRILNTLHQELLKRRRQADQPCLDFLGTVATDDSLSNEQILDLVLNMLFAGHETSSVALTLALNFLAISPPSLQALRIEHREIQSMKKGSSRRLGWDDYKGMVFTQYVINETLRLGNVVRFVHRKTLQDVHFKGYRIPRGWKVLPVFSSVHLDSSVFAHPLTFDPWRWKDLPKQIYFTPFGGGSRLCAGAELAKLEIAIFLHHLVLDYEWMREEADEALAFPFVEFRKGLPLKVRKLQHHHEGGDGDEE